MSKQLPHPPKAAEAGNTKPLAVACPVALDDYLLASKIFTKEEQLRILTLYVNRVKLSDIAADLKRDDQQIDNLLALARRRGLRRMEKDRPVRMQVPFVPAPTEAQRKAAERAESLKSQKKRRCLRCGNLFTSSWAGNRLCGRHSEGDPFDGDYKVVGTQK